ncbi:MAG: S1-like domain-containing RNA-binding protein, partial [Prevotella sp.]|nr:S1-like domain-containing RNA-binding protein [Prevotella sp.]
MPDIRLGDYARLAVTKTAPFGVYLDGGDAGEILLPSRYVPENTAVGDELDVFIYLDQEERIIATTERPKAKTGDFAYLEVSWVNEYGAFLNWGLMKDLFCPFGEQKKKMEQGQSYIVYIYVDKQTFRIAATAKIDRFLSKDVAALSEGQEVDLLVWQKTELGFKVIIDNKFGGLVYADQIFAPIRTGDRLKGYIQKVRGDGKVDVSLQQTGKKGTRDFAGELLDYLRAHDGRCAFSDSSLPQDIYDEFHVSKKVFKKAAGNLYRRRLITVHDDG